MSGFVVCASVLLIPRHHPGNTKCPMAAFVILFFFRRPRLSEIHVFEYAGRFIKCTLHSSVCVCVTGSCRLIAGFFKNRVSIFEYTYVHLFHITCTCYVRTRARVHTPQQGTGATQSLIRNSRTGLGRRSCLTLLDCSVLGG